MGKLLPCSRCGVVPFKETRWVTSDSRRYSLTHVCDSRYARDWETLVAEWNAANAPADPALLALANAVRKWAKWVGAVHVGSPEHELFLMAKEQGLIDA